MYHSWVSDNLYEEFELVGFELPRTRQRAPLPPPSYIRRKMIVAFAGTKLAGIIAEICRLSSTSQHQVPKVGLLTKLNSRAEWLRRRLFRTQQNRGGHYPREPFSFFISAFDNWLGVVAMLSATLCATICCMRRSHGAAADSSADKRVLRQSWVFRCAEKWHQ